MENKFQEIFFEIRAGVGGEEAAIGRIVRQLTTTKKNISKKIKRR